MALNTSTLTARRDSFDRNTSAFSPSLDYNASVVANGNGTANRKWPVNNYGALGTMASVSPLAAPGTPPPTGKPYIHLELKAKQIFPALFSSFSILLVKSRVKNLRLVSKED